MKHVIDIGHTIASHWGEIVGAIAVLWTVVQEIRHQWNKR